MGYAFIDIYSSYFLTSSSSMYSMYVFKDLFIFTYLSVCTVDSNLHPHSIFVFCLFAFVCVNSYLFVY